MLLSKETYKWEVQFFFYCFTTSLLNVLTRGKYLSIYICAVLHVQIMLEHINISFEQAIKQSFYTGVSKTRQSAGKQIKHLCAFIILVRYIHNILFLAAHMTRWRSSRQSISSWKVNFTVYTVKFAQNTVKRQKVETIFLKVELLLIWMLCF